MFSSKFHHRLETIEASIDRVNRAAAVVCLAFRFNRICFSNLWTSFRAHLVNLQTECLGRQLTAAIKCCSLFSSSRSFNQRLKVRKRSEVMLLEGFLARKTESDLVVAQEALKIERESELIALYLVMGASSVFLLLSTRESSKRNVSINFALSADQDTHKSSAAMTNEKKCWSCGTGSRSRRATCMRTSSPLIK